VEGVAILPIETAEEEVQEWLLKTPLTFGV